MGVNTCYESYNTQGNVYGNCGYTATDYIPCTQRYNNHNLSANNSHINEISCLMLISWIILLILQLIIIYVLLYTTSECL